VSEEENDNNIDNRIIEEKEEYENDESSFKNTKTKLKELRHYSANLTQKKVKDIEVNKTKKSVRSEQIKNKKDISEKDIINNYKSINSNNNSIYKQIAGKSVTSYEVESDSPNIENNFNK
jgi:hypothetical protein